MYTFSSSLCTDCIECSEDGQTVALGCYQLESDGNKIGGVYLFNNTLDNEPKFIETDAILDMKWRGIELLLATNSRGLAVIKGQDVVEYSNSVNQDQSVYLSLDYNHDFIYTSTNTGIVNIFDHSLNLIDTIPAHDFETWAVCSDGYNVFYTGADDALMKGWDVRSKDRLFVNKQHSAGVCSIIVLNENRLASGSYDKQVRIWDKRKPTCLLSSCRVESGVWRLKRMSSDGILAACMHDGFYVFNCSDRIAVDRHESIPGLAYGCSFDPHNRRVFSCCFYHKQAQEWTVN